MFQVLSTATDCKLFLNQTASLLLLRPGKNNIIDENKEVIDISDEDEVASENEEVELEEEESLGSETKSDEEWEAMIPLSKKLYSEWLKVPRVSGAKCKKK